MDSKTNMSNLAGRTQDKGEAGLAAGAITDVEYWNKQQTVAAAESLEPTHPRWFRPFSRFLPESAETTILEVGVVPGSLLLFFAKNRHYRCSGLDFSPQIRCLPALFEKEGIEATFIETDFFNWASDETFDIVYSCGFIEHFTDYETTIKKHWERVRPGGLMILSVPTFKPLVQWWIRRFFYEPWFLEQALSSHNLAIMSLDALKRSVANACHDAHVVSAIREPGVHLFFDINGSGIRRGKRYELLWTLLKVADKALTFAHISCRWTSGRRRGDREKREPVSTR